MNALLKGLGLDQYQRTAHLQPAMIVVAPISVIAFLWAPKASALVGTFVSGVATLGLLNLLMQFGRSKGRKVQRLMISETGALPSALALRHADPHVPAGLKKRYHLALAKHGFPMPSEHEESADPAGALEAYKAASAWLPDQTRDQKKFELLHAENRGYGFRRNLLGLKPIGIAVISICLVINAILTWIYRSDLDRLTVSAIVSIALVIGVISWLFVVNRAFVEDAGWAYAERQLAACEKITAKKSPAVKAL